MDLSKIEGIISAIEAEVELASSNHVQLASLTARALTEVIALIAPLKTSQDSITALISKENVSSTFDKQGMEQNDIG